MKVRGLLCHRFLLLSSRLFPHSTAQECSFVCRFVWSEKPGGARSDRLPLASQFIFYSASEFNSDLNSWDTSSLTDMEVRGVAASSLARVPIQRLLVLMLVSWQHFSDRLALAPQNTFRLASAFNLDIDS